MSPYIRSSLSYWTVSAGHWLISADHCPVLVTGKIFQCWSLVPFLKQCWALVRPSAGHWGHVLKKKEYSKNMYPRRVWLYMVKQKGYPIHIGMPSVIQKIIHAFRPYLNIFAIRVGAVNFTNFGMASTTEKEPCGRNRCPGREVNTFFSYSNIL